MESLLWMVSSVTKHTDAYVGLSAFVNAYIHHKFMQILRNNMYKSTFLMCIGIQLYIQHTAYDINLSHDKMTQQNGELGSWKGPASQPVQHFVHQQYTFGSLKFKCICSSTVATKIFHMSYLLGSPWKQVSWMLDSHPKKSLENSSNHFQRRGRFVFDIFPMSWT